MIFGQKTLITYINIPFIKIYLDSESILYKPIMLLPPVKTILKKPFSKIDLLAIFNISFAKFLYKDFFLLKMK